MERSGLVSRLRLFRAIHLIVLENTSRTDRVER